MRRAIDVRELEFEEGGRTIWVHGDFGTVLRIQLPQGTQITTEKCRDGALSSHMDLTVSELADVRPAVFCLGEDVSR